VWPAIGTWPLWRCCTQVNGGSRAQAQLTQFQTAFLRLRACAPAAGLQQRFHFPCGSWIKGASSLQLQPGQPGAACTSSGHARYRVDVATSDTRGAGTDAEVTMVLYGSGGDTGPRRLESSANDFERGKTDTFFFEAPDVGEPQSLRIGHNGASPGSAWHLASVMVTNLSSGQSVVFPHHGWLDGAGGGASVLLHPDRDGGGSGDAGQAPALAEYTVRVVTADTRWAQLLCLEASDGHRRCA
jgi:hypothetical protein